MATYNQMVVRVSVCDPQGELLPALSELALFYDNSTECHPERSSYGEFNHWCHPLEEIRNVRKRRVETTPRRQYAI